MRKLLLIFLFISSVLPQISQGQSLGDWDSEFIGSEPTVPFFPDGSANYWTYSFRNQHGLWYRLKGKIPQARYFSFNLYDENRASTGSLIDNEILKAGTDSFEVYLVPKSHSLRALDSLQSRFGLNHPAKKLLCYPDGGSLTDKSSVFYRTYRAEIDNYGGVPLPSIDAVDPVSMQEVSLPGNGINYLGLESLYQLAGLYLSQEVLEQYLDSRTDSIIAIKTAGAGYFENKDNAYLIMPIVRNLNDVAIFKFRPPTYSLTPTDSSKEVRYWSFAQSDAETFTYLTRYDEQMQVHSDGFVYIAIGAWLPTRQSITYNPMDWEVPDSQEMILLYRNLLPNPSFSYPVQIVPEGSAAYAYIGDYAPVGRLVSQTEFRLNGFQSLQGSGSGNKTLPEIAEAQYEVNTKVSIYPNPVRDLLHVELDASQGEQGRVSLLSLDGQCLRKVPFAQQSHIEIPVNDLPQGLYFLKVSGNRETTQKVLIMGE